MSAHYEFGPPLGSTTVVSLHRGSRLGVHGFARPVSLAVVHPELARETSFSRAFFEAAACFANLSEPNLLAVEDVADEGGRLFVASPAITGFSLAHVIARPPSRANAMPPSFACKLVLALADAVTKVVECLPVGSALGGVSAEAAWLTEAGDALLMPTALCAAKVPARCRKVALSRYRAPELDRSKPAGPSADVYSLGLLLWDLLSFGRAPVPRRLDDATRAAGPAIDSGIVGLVMRCLSPSPAERPAGTAAFRAELARCVSNATMRADRVRARRGRGGGSDRCAVASRPPSPDTIEIRTDELQCMGGGPRYDVAEAPIRQIDEYGRGARPSVPRPALLPPTSPCRDGATQRRSVAPRLVGSEGMVLGLHGNAGRWVVGRGRTADLVVLDPDMSREHFEVVRGVDGLFRIRDLSSKNGLFVNGRRSETAVLRPLDEVRAGATILRFAP